MNLSLRQPVPPQTQTVLALVDWAKICLTNAMGVKNSSAGQQARQPTILHAHATMEPTIANAFAHKHVFITGGTGFLAKAMIEKLLRSIPDIEKIYVLIRPRKGVDGVQRLEKEIINSPIFDRLRREHGSLDAGNAFLRTKLRAVGGDVTSPLLGLSVDDQRLLQENIHIMIHSAATVQFDEPLEVAVEMNCLGALNALAFVQTCPRIQCHLHVSTAYVNSNLRGGTAVRTIREELYPLDFDVEDALSAVAQASASDLERLRVNLIGTYPNTYALTKSMAEHLLVRRARSDLPMVIFRPTIIGASWKEPVPGWIDQIAGAGAIFLAGGMGVLSILPGDPRNVADIVPVDLSVNTALAAAAAVVHDHQRRLPQPLIVHSGTSDPRQNPVRWRVPAGVALKYFQQNPPVRRLFEPKFHMIPTHQQFQIEWFFKYALPSSVYSTVANRSGSETHIRNAAKLWTLTWRARQLVELFKPFTENQWVYACDSLDLFRSVARPESDWWLDATEIAWERYIFNFCVGLKKYMLHEDVIDVDIEGVAHTELALSTGRILEWDPDHHAISFPGLFPDVSWAYTSSRKPGYTKSGVLGRVLGLTGWREGQSHEASHVPRVHVESLGGVRNAVLEAPAVRAAVDALAASSGRVRSDVDAEALSILDTMAARVDYKAVRKAGYLLRKVFRSMYDSIHVDEQGLSRVRELLARKQSVVLVPTHRSYVDFLLLSYLFFAYNLPVPHIAAGNDFLGMGGGVSELLRQCGAYFIRRSFREDPLYSAIFDEYTKYLVSNGHPVEFFIEGMRSRSGKQLHPKMGILSTVVDCVLSGRVQDVHIVPVTIDYEKPLEVLLHQHEMLGEGKVKESLSALLQSWRVTRQKFGSIAVQFAAPISVQQFAAAEGISPSSPSSPPSSAPLVRELAYAVTHAMVDASTCTTTHLVATVLLLFRQGIATAELVKQTDWLRREVLRRGGRVLGTQGRARDVVVDAALALLKELVVRRRKDLVEPAIAAREQYANMIGLGYYRNKLLHWFQREGAVACAHHALAAFSGGDGVAQAELVDGAAFLHELLLHEFVRKDCERDREELAATVDAMVDRGVLVVGDKAVVAVGDKALFSLLCMLVWPFVDSYWVAIQSLFAVRASASAVRADDLLKRIQWLAETMYHEKLISFYESCSLETLQNALALLERWQVIERFQPPSKRPRKAPGPMMIRLTPQYAGENALEELALRVGRFRKLPADAGASVAGFGHASHLITQLPALSKM